MTAICRASLSVLHSVIGGGERRRNRRVPRECPGSKPAEFLGRPGRRRGVSGASIPSRICRVPFVEPPSITMSSKGRQPPGQAPQRDCVAYEAGAIANGQTTPTSVDGYTISRDEADARAQVEVTCSTTIRASCSPGRGLASRAARVQSIMQCHVAGDLPDSPRRIARTDEPVEVLPDTQHRIECPTRSKACRRKNGSPGRAAPTARRRIGERHGPSSERIRGTALHARTIRLLAQCGVAKPQAGVRHSSSASRKAMRSPRTARSPHCAPRPRRHSPAGIAPHHRRATHSTRGSSRSSHHR